jgi:diguanylate cyclase (GGDEF)-like protein/PAS domain S-box-containing protein
VKIRCIVFLLILLCLTSAVPIRAATPGPSTSAGADALAVDVYGNEYSDSIFYQNSKHPIAFHGAVVFAVVSSAYFLLRLRKRKKELAEVNDRLDRYNRLIQTFLNSDSGYVFLKDGRLNYVIVNEAMRKALRRPRDQIIGRGDFELMPQSLSKISTMADAEVLMNQAELTETVQWRNRYFRSTKFPVGMPDGSTGVGAYISDVTDERTEQMRHERELAWHKRMMEMLTGTFPDRHQQLEYALQIARELSESEHGCLAFYEEETEVYTAEIFSVSEQDSVAAIDESKIKRLFKEVRDKAVADKQPVMDNRFSDTDPCDGQHFIHNLLCVPIIVAGQAVAVVGLCNKGSDYDEVDVSELTMFMTSVWNAVKRRKHMTMLAQERDRFFKTIMSIGDAVIVVSRDGRIQMINDIATGLTGWPRFEAIGADYRDVFCLSHEEEGEVILDPVVQVLQTGELYELENYAILISRNGMRYDIENSASPVFGEAGDIDSVVVVFRDATKRKTQRREMEYLSLRDPLTGLYNRRFFEEEMQRLDTKRNMPMSLILCDVNGLKLTNDIFGHAYGDELIKRVAEVLRESCRAEDILARWGGDEFVLLLPGTDYAQAADIAARISEDIASQSIQAIQSSASVGFAVKEAIEEDAADFLQRAETMMYRQKAIERHAQQEQNLTSIIGLLHRDEQQVQHSETVSELSRQFGMFLGLSDEQVRIASEAARLHDIGMVVDIGRQANRSEWTDAERAESFRRHPIAGYQILSSFDKTLDLADTVLAHHERWDGNGYPKGLKGEEIPRLSRIISICGYYEYYCRTGGDCASAMETIQKKAGTQFDPEMAADFLRFIETQS